MCSEEFIEPISFLCTNNQIFKGQEERIERFEECSNNNNKRYFTERRMPSQSLQPHLLNCLHCIHDGWMRHALLVVLIYLHYIESMTKGYLRCFSWAILHMVIWWERSKVSKYSSATHFTRHSFIHFGDSELNQNILKI